MDGRFTDEELAIAKSVDLCAVAESLGYTVKRIGKYHTLKEMDSIRIYNRSHWYRWSRQFDKGNNGGSQIDFLRVFCGMSVKEAVFWLLDFAGYRRIEKPVKQPLVHQVSQKQAEERKPFVLPELAGDNSYLISYLNQERGISRTVIDLFLKDGLIYESRHYHNVVFKGNDKNGVTRFASMRGVFDKQGKPFKCDVTGNDKNYGFNVVNVNSTELVVFEAAIDLMSYVDIFADYESNKLALGMLADAPLETFLREHPQITSIRFCLDGDEPGRKAAAELMRKYYELGYEVEDCPPPAGYKDYNEWLVAAKLNLNQIDRYQESVAMGLTARQLIFSIASVVVGGGIVLLLYKYIGLTGSAYVAIPCVAPIALGGFYSFNGMNFYEYMGKKLHFMFGNRALTYVSTEGEPAIKQLEAEQNEQVKKKGRKAEPETVTADSAVKKQEEFEAMKKKTRNMLLGLVAVIVAAVAGIAAYKAMH